MFRVYILQSQTSGRFYVGHTERIDSRVHEHNSGQTKSTRNKGPWVLVHQEGFDTRAEAVKRENEIKRWKSHRTIQELIDGNR